jgi:nucleotide-binding universal stress UspA family protein
MVRKILAPTDLSELSRVGVHCALKKARDNGAEVIVYYAVTPDELLKLGDTIRAIEVVRRDFPNLMNEYLHDYRRGVARFVRENFSDLLADVRVHEEVELGRPEKTIVERAKAEAVDLIIMATHGRGGLSRVFLGSVTERVVRNAPCPVLVIPPHLAKSDEDLYLPPVDGKRVSP